MRKNQSYRSEPHFSILLKVTLKNFKRMLLVHRFDEVFRFSNWFFVAFLLIWLKNLRAQFGLYQKNAGVRTPWTLPLDVLLKKYRRVISHDTEEGCKVLKKLTCSFKHDIRNLVNFHPTIQKSENCFLSEV